MKKLLTLSLKLILYTFIALIFLQCTNERKKTNEITFKDKEEYKEIMILSHQAFLLKEKERIDAYIDSTGKDFEKTGTGLRYHVYKNGEGEKLVKGDIAVLKYKQYLLNGTELYLEDSSKVKELMVDFENVESGLNEALKYLSVGDKALLIIPAHLAYGITGDQKEISSQSTLLFDVNLIGKK